MMHLIQLIFPQSFYLWKEAPAHEQLYKAPRRETTSNRSVFQLGHTMHNGTHVNFQFSHGGERELLTKMHSVAVNTSPTAAFFESQI